MARFKPEPLADHHAIDGFDCGRESLNAWLTQRARKSELVGDARTFVVANPRTKVVLGYHAMAAGSVDRGGVGGALARNAPDPIPVVILARLAVGLKQQSSGLGKVLLCDAATRAVAAATGIGARALFVNAIDDAARLFYIRFGFTETRSDPNALYLPIASIRAAYEKESAARANTPAADSVS